ncbi:hypothetical protein Ancab_029478 [Ancistrocladus abbreviatus]
MESRRNEEEERKRIDIMRAFVESQDPSSKEVDNLMLRRFLRARSLDVEKASQLLLKYLKWRREFVPKGCISESEIPNEIADNKAFLQGFDKKGCPILLFLGARHFQNQQTDGLDEFKRNIGYFPLSCSIFRNCIKLLNCSTKSPGFVVYMLDKTCSRIPAGEEKFVVIADLQGWGYSNSDIGGYIAALTVLQEFHPERLRKLFIANAPRIFATVWKILCPFIDKETKSKIIFVEKRVLRSTLLEEIEEEQLPQTYGGKQPLIPIHQA